MSGKIVSDPVHGYIFFSEKERLLIDSPWFQRLRHCSQNGPTRLVYPSLVGTRFEHSLGVMELASQILDSVIDKREYEKRSGVIGEFLRLCKRDLRLFLGRNKKNDVGTINDLRQILRSSALCHDLGHFPLSHTLERAFRLEYWMSPIPVYYPARECHELVSIEIVRHILEIRDPALEDWVARGVILTLLAPSRLTIKYGQKDLPFEKTMFHTLNGILMGDYDADRLDYLQRDGYLSGSGFGHFDAQRFINAMMIVKKREGVYEVLPGSHALSTIEAALVERYKLYKWVNFHHKSLFFDEICCEAARKIIKSKEVANKMFGKYKNDPGKPEDYLKSVFESLSLSEGKIPPLILFRGRDLGLPHSYYTLNPEFFILNKDSHFFDDVWFCLKCREKQKHGKASTFWLETLVDRKACGMTLWKDWSQFEKFDEKCIREALKSTELAKVAEGNLKRYTQEFLNRLYQLMREGRFPEIICHKMLDHANSELKKVNSCSLRALIRVANWRLFEKKLQDKEIVGKTGGVDYLMKHSSLLRALSDLKNEVPFYFFVIGESLDLEKIKKNKGMKEKVLTIIAKIFILSIAECFDNDVAVEIPGAWNDAKKQGS